MSLSILTNSAKAIEFGMDMVEETFKEYQKDTKKGKAYVSFYYNDITQFSAGVTIFNRKKKDFKSDFKTIEIGTKVSHIRIGNAELGSFGLGYGYSFNTMIAFERSLLYESGGVYLGGGVFFNFSGGITRLDFLTPTTKSPSGESQIKAGSIIVSFTIGLGAF